MRTVKQHGSHIKYKFSIVFIGSIIQNSGTRHVKLCGDGLQMCILSFKEDKAREVVGRCGQPHTTGSVKSCLKIVMCLSNITHVCMGKCLSAHIWITVHILCETFLLIFNVNKRAKNTNFGG